MGTVKCEYCGTTENVKPRSAMTAYHWDGKGENPNRDVILCDVCYEDYKAHWNSMWDEYRSSQGF